MEIVSNVYDGPYNIFGVPIASAGTDVELLLVNASAISDANVDELQALASYASNPYPLVYDEIVTCLGFKHNMDIYDEDTRPLLQSNGKYAVMTEQYEAVGVPGMFFVGTLAHGKDYRRSAGGFIHGFRYVAKVRAERARKRWHLTWRS
jgi:hypothetical protein